MPDAIAGYTIRGAYWLLDKGRIDRTGKAPTSSYGSEPFEPAIAIHGQGLLSSEGKEGYRAPGFGGGRHSRRGNRVRDPRRCALG